MGYMRKELVDFWRKFGKLLSSGVPILHTLETIKQETSNQKLQAVIEDIKTTIKHGEDIPKSFAKYPEYFSPSVQAMLKAGEAGGALDTLSIKIADGLEDGTFKVGEKSFEKKEIEPLKKENEESSAIKLASSIIKDAFKSRASDIHIEWLRDKMRLRYRIDGVLKEIASPPPKELWESLISRIKLMAGMDVAEKKLPQDGRIQLNIEGKDLDLRVSIVPYITGEAITMRILDRSAMLLLPLEKQGLSEQNLGMLRNWSKKRNGMIVAAGPTGCGKTTTLYTLLTELNREDVKITTVEDPVEYQIDGIDQQQINPRIGLTFAQALRSQLRQDPDITMVGEIRDLETAEMVVRASLTGHLIFTTLHTYDASGAVRRLLDIGIKPFLINSSLMGVLSQRLVRTICQNCKEEYKPENWVIELTRAHKDMKFFRGKGCEKCNKTGYRGRTAIHELLEIDDNMKSLIAQDAGLEKLRKQAKESGMITLREDGIDKVKQGITTIEEVLRVVPGS